MCKYTAATVVYAWLFVGSVRCVYVKGSVVVPSSPSLLSQVGLGSQQSVTVQVPDGQSTPVSVS